MAEGPGVGEEVLLGHCCVCDAQVVWDEKLSGWIHLCDRPAGDEHQAEPMRVRRQ